uniref:NAC domain-containing protein n=1 Tax=Nelumbo nucifera TaxID=4432 RepID=A0A822Z9Z6_NELNU|nr:TPA_asm: hypothetical protein HUJ06_008989 [Nelumbo nucifera]
MGMVPGIDWKYLNGSWPNWSIEDGYWKATGADKSIYSDSVHVGYRKAWVFYKGKPVKDKHEPCVRQMEWYFFTHRDQKYLNGSRPNRSIGDGYWKATRADKSIYNDSVHVGYRKS